MPNHPWLLVDSPLKAREASRDIASSSLIGLDTEYDSFHYFREKLCLIQIRAQEKTYLFDPFRPLDISFLGEHFASPAICKVMHAGDNDIRLLKREYNFSFTNIFDTFRAASLLGCHRLALAAVIGQYLGIEFEKNKKMQRSRWDRRPLTEGQLRYAVLDTAYLFPLYRRLEMELGEAGLIEEAVALFEGMTKIKWKKKLPDAEAYKKIARYDTLTEEQKARLRNIFWWRYEKAKESNRAIFMILSDQELLDLSSLRIESYDELLENSALPMEKMRLFGKELLDLL